ncbi:MAG: pilin [Patescibacteria group bacterium]
MKTFPKILTILFLTVFILQIICVFFLLLAPAASHATKAEPVIFKPQVDIPGMSDNFEKPSDSEGYIIPTDTGGIAKYIRVIYKYAIGIVGILAAVVLMLGGVLWLTAGGNTTRVTEAKAWITASLTGLVLALSSYLILATVNPALVNFEVTKIESVEKIILGCCLTNGKSENTKETACKGKFTENGISRNNQCVLSTDKGCCNFNALTYINVLSGNDRAKCKDDIPQTQCDKLISLFYPNKACKDTVGCKEYCAETGREGVACQIPGWDRAICHEKNCVKCNRHIDGPCTSDKPCCEGLYCSSMPGGNDICRTSWPIGGPCDPLIVNMCKKGLKCDSSTRRCVNK